MTRRVTAADAIAANPSLAARNLSVVVAAPKPPRAGDAAAGTTRRSLPTAAAARKALGQSHAARSGLAGEALVVGVYHAAALARGVARLTKVPTPTLGANGARRFSAKAGVDCMGYLLRGPRRGVAILEEIKSTRAARWPLSKLPAAQRQALADGHAAGCVCVLTLAFGAAVYVIPWAMVAGWIGAGVKSLPAADLGTWRVVPETYLAPWATS